ncbi:hypothetical protein [Nocardia sp. NPDC003345]
MGFWSGVGDFFSEYGDDILVGAVSVAGFAVAGPLGAAAAGAVAGGIAAGVQGENIAMGAGFGALGGLVGGVGSFGVRGLVGAGKSVAKAQATTAAEKLALNRGLLGALPSKIGGAHLTPGRTYLGLLGAASAPSLGNYFEDAFRREILGYSAIPLIDISESDWPDKMAHVFMPDPGQLPSGLDFTPPMQQNYRTLPPMYHGFWKQFGKDPADNILPEELDVSDISGEDAANIPHYRERVAVMREQYGRIRSASRIVVNAVNRSAELCTAGRGDLGSALKALKDFAGTDPRDVEGIKKHAGEYTEKPSENTGLPILAVDLTLLTGEANEDAYVMVLVEAAISTAEALVAAYGEAFQQLADETEQQTPDKPTDKNTEKKTAGEKENDGADTRNSGTDPSFRPTGNTQAPGTETPRTATAAQTGPPPALDLTGTDTPSAESGTDAGAGSGTDRAVNAGDPRGLSGRSETTPGAVGTPALATPSMSGTTASGMGLESMMLPLMMRAMMNGRGSEGDERRRDSRDRDEDRFGGAPVPAAPAPGAAQQPATQSTPQSTTQSAPAKSVAPPAKPTAPPVAAAATKTSAENTVYTFPDGRTQEVSAVVARVLDAAFGNAAGTDARRAYEGTVAAWTDPKRIGSRVDPSQLMTGDVGTWENRTAVLAVFGSDMDGRVEAVVDGVLRVVDALAEMNDGGGAFGGFTGFFHPPGIEKAVADGSAPALEPSGDQTSTAVPA